MITKIFTWIKVNIASVIGAIQAALKILKEVITAILNVISILMPATTAQKMVLFARDVVNTIDGWFEKIKEWLKLIPAV